MAPETPELDAEAALLREREFADRVLDTAPVIVLVLDREGRVIRFNRYMEQLSGYTLAEVKGADWFETFIPKRDRERIQNVFRSSLSGSRTRGNVNSIVTKDGRERLIEWYDTQLQDSRELAGIVAVGLDITEQSRLEEEYRHAQKMEAIGTLASGIAHDFNNLLMGIIGMAEMSLSHLKAGEEARRFVVEIQKAAQDGASIVSQLMAFSRKDEAKAEASELDELLKSRSHMLHTLLGEDVELQLKLAASGRFVAVPRGLLEQILMNLCVNARHAMPDGGTLNIRTESVQFGTTEATTRAGLEAGDFVSIEIADTGQGMDDATRKRIFEPFFTTKEEGAGTGLGLSTVYGIIRQGGGHIEVHSELDVGTRFRILLPCVEAEELRPAPVEPTPTVTPSATVLVVEDERLVRLTTRYYLEEAGYRVLEAQGGKEALQICAEESLDIVLSDIVLPGVQGHVLAGQLKAKQAGLPVVFMSAHPPELLLEQGRVSHDDLVLLKPFEAADLLGVVQRALTPRNEESCTLLLVEDYEVAREAMRELLTEEGYRVIAVGDRAQALAAARQAARIDLVVADLGLPDGSGLDLVDELAADNPGLGVIYLTGRSADEEIEASMDRHGAVLLTKPVELSALADAVRDRLE